MILSSLIFLLTACGGEVKNANELTVSETVKTPSSMQNTMEKTYTENEEISLEFSYGIRKGIYTGQLKNGLPHGEGVFSSVSSDGISWVYRGQWSEGHCNGQGSTIWDSGQMEIGKYVNDELQGDGLALSNDGVVYKGKFIKGTPTPDISSLTEAATHTENETIKGTEKTIESETETESQSEQVSIFIFTPGAYAVGKDIPSGIYNVVKEDGIGNLTIRDENDHLKEIISDSYNNLKLESKYTFEISIGAKYSFTQTE